jgi:hypothetical protein
MRTPYRLQLRIPIVFSLSLINSHLIKKNAPFTSISDKCNQIKHSNVIIPF